MSWRMRGGGGCRGAGGGEGGRDIGRGPPASAFSSAFSSKLLNMHKIQTLHSPMPRANLTIYNLEGAFSSVLVLVLPQRIRRSVARCTAVVFGLVPLPSFVTHGRHGGRCLHGPPRRQEREPWRQRRPRAARDSGEAGNSGWRWSQPELSTLSFT